MHTDTPIELAGLRLANPAIAGSGEATMTRDQTMATRDPGAATVVEKW
jgi:hypothetical protein